MSTAEAQTGLALRSLVTDDGVLEISLVETPFPSPSETQVVIRVEASPVNPSDVGLLFAGVDLATLSGSISHDRSLVTAPVEQAALNSLKGRIGISMPVGNEGAGTVVAAGPSASAQELLGKVVAVGSGGMYAQYRRVEASQCLVLPEGASARSGASAFINPLTALGMIETMRLEGHRALVHTAAASNLGQMLVKLCLEDEIPLVNIVRRPEQADLLRSLGATYVCDSSADSFHDDLTECLRTTSATLAFDATGGGTLASQILTAMESAAVNESETYNRYGSTVHKQVYLYGSLDRGPTVINRNFGVAWGVGGWLLTMFLQKIGAESSATLRARVADELATTFASSYANEITLTEALDIGTIDKYVRFATGEKYLITPQAD